MIFALISAFLLSSAESTTKFFELCACKGIAAAVMVQRQGTENESPLVWIDAAAIAQHLSYQALEEITLFKSVGTALEDLAVAAEVYQRFLAA